MCGIYGQYNFGHDTPVVDRDVRQATRTLFHRGPDDEGFHAVNDKNGGQDRCRP